jgi:hypothetical protein
MELGEEVLAGLVKLLRAVSVFSVSPWFILLDDSILC